MHPLDCPEWEYNGHPNRGLISVRIADIVFDLRTEAKSTLTVAADTRESHRAVFHDLVPVRYEYYAGHYRGELFRCLRFYSVGIQGDPRVGATPDTVKFLMTELGATIRAALLALDGNVLLPDREKLRYIVVCACQVFVHFLTIHPYANGNGHMGRLVVWSILGRYGHWPNRWTIEPRPPDPPYSELIVRYRNGDREPLERYIVQMLIS
jgi:hypothetical protein